LAWNSLPDNLRDPSVSRAPPQTPLGSLQRSPRLLAGLKGTYFQGKGGEGKGGRGRGGGREFDIHNF